MSRGINKVILIGNATMDPDVRYMPSGTAVASFSLATNERWNDKATGETKEKAEFHRVAMFGKIAEIAGQYLRKGSKVYIEGRLQTREWEKDGIKRYTTEIIVDMRGQMQMLDSQQQGGQQQYQQPQYQHQQGAPRQAPAPAYQPNDFDSEVPF